MTGPAHEADPKLFSRRFDPFKVAGMAIIVTCSIFLDVDIWPGSFSLFFLMNIALQCVVIVLMLVTFFRRKSCDSPEGAMSSESATYAGHVITGLKSLRAGLAIWGIAHGWWDIWIPVFLLGLCIKKISPDVTAQPPLDTATNTSIESVPWRELFGIRTPGFGILGFILICFIIFSLLMSLPLVLIGGTRILTQIIFTPLIMVIFVLSSINTREIMRRLRKRLRFRFTTAIVMMLLSAVLLWPNVCAHSKQNPQSSGASLYGWPASFSIPLDGNTNNPDHFLFSVWSLEIDVVLGLVLILGTFIVMEYEIFSLAAQFLWEILESMLSLRDRH